MNLTYAAERKVWLGAKARPHNQPISLNTARDILDRCGLHEWQLKSTGQGNYGCCYISRKLITVGSHRTAWVIVHEAAHALSPGKRGHNAAFRGEYVRLTGIVFGDYWANRLRLSFERHGLRVIESTTKTQEENE